MKSTYAQLHSVAQLEANEGPRKVGFLFTTLERVRVDRDAGIIYGASVMSVGPARGHGFIVDATTLQQTAACLAQPADGVKVRFNHPQPKPNMPLGDATGKVIGRLKGARVDGDRIIGDIHIGLYAATVPELGNVRDYILNMAENDPTAIGLSPVIGYEIELQNGAPLARVFDVPAVDFVDDPATNRRGLLSAQDTGALPGVDSQVPPLKGGPHMDPKLTELLASMGLDPKATPEQVAEFCAKLSAEQKASLAAAGFGDDKLPKPAGMSAGTPAANPAAPATLAARQAPVLATAALATAATLAAATGQPDIVEQEQRRVASLQALGKLYNVGDDVVRTAIAGRLTPEQAMPAFLQALQAGNPDFSNVRPGSVRVGEDRNIASLGAGVSDAISLRAGLQIQEPHERSREFRGMTMIEMGRAYLNAVGVDTRGWSREKIAKGVFNRANYASLAMSTSDFPYILGDVMGKTLRTSYDETPSTWSLWVRRNTAPDFKDIKRDVLSNAGRLRRLKPRQEYPNTQLSEERATYALSKFGQIIDFTWESMINDDMSAFKDIPRKQGNAAKRLEDDLVYYVLLKNANMADGGALFNNTAVTTAGGHANLGSSAALSVAELGKGLAAMRKQTGLKGEILNVVPAFLIVCAGIEAIADQVINSTFDPSKQNSISKNPFTKGGRTPLTLIVEPRIDNGVSIETETGALDTVAGSSTAWFLAAANSLIDTVELSFLEDQPAPVVEEEDSFRTDGRSYKVRHVAAAAAIDYRGLWKNAGA